VFFHCPLVLDEQGRRLAKRHDALAIRTLREAGETPQDIWRRCAARPAPTS
jgi:glutamyl-tRNA synthetase